MSLESLVNQLSTNSNVIKLIEKEIERLVALPDLAQLKELRCSRNPAVNVYLCKVLELRIRRGITKRPLGLEIEFVTELLQQNQSYHVCEVYSLLGLFCWPAEMPNFLTDTASLLNCTTGYQILLLFLEKMNSSTDIDDKRRGELKKAIGIVSKDLMAQFQGSFAELIIPIFTELTKIIPLNYDCAIVFGSAAECPEAVIEFFSEASHLLDSNKIVAVVDQLPTDRGMLQVLGSFKMRSINDPQKIYEYVFKCLVEDPECFIPAVDFWQRIFSSKDNGSILNPVLVEVTKAYLGIDEETKEEADGFVFGFFSIAAKNYPEISVEFLRHNENILPVRITANFLQKIAKSSDCLSGLTFQNIYLNTLACFLRGDPGTPALISSLDFADKDAVKLILQIMGRYEFSTQQTMAVLKMCDDGCLHANELRVECMARLGVRGSFGGEWSMDKVIEYYYFLKRDRTAYIEYKESFHRLFIQNAPFDRCFSIVHMIGDISDPILRAIYGKMDKYPYIELCCFNNDLLIHLDPEIQRPFLEKQVCRFVSEWVAVKDYREYYQSLKSLLNVFNSKIEQPGMVDLMLDLVQIDYCMILNRIISIFNGYKGVYSTQKAVYFFIVAYNAPNLGESQAQLAAALTSCLYQQDGPLAFSEILSLDVNKCCDARSQMEKVNRKTAQNIVRNLLRDFKGKALRNLYENELKVTKQNFLNEKKTIEESYD